MRTLTGLSRYAVMLMICMPGLLIGCGEHSSSEGKLWRTTDDQYSAGHEIFPLNSEAFALTHGKGCFFGGYQVLEISPDGTAVYIGWKDNQADPEWLKWTGRLSPEQQAGLAEAILTHRLPTMKARYQTNYADAERSIVIIESEGESKLIIADDYVPDELKQFEEYLQNEILAELRRSGSLKSIPKREADRASRRMLRVE